MANLNDNELKLPDIFIKTEPDLEGNTNNENKSQEEIQHENTAIDRIKTEIENGNMSDSKKLNYSDESNRTQVAIKTEPDSHAGDDSSLDDESNEEKSKANAVTEQTHSDKENESDENNINSKVKNEADNKQDTNRTTVAAAATSSTRERCMYGEQCYRRNPAHLSMYAHPGDSDYGVGRPRCEYGARCRRSHPRHWQQYTHPTGYGPTNQPSKRRPNVHTRISHDSDSDESDSDIQQDLIVGGKRKRRPIVTEAWSDEDSQFEDPFGTDDSDEWTPNQDSNQAIT